MSVRRREFLKTTLIAGAAAQVPRSTWARAPGANDAIRVGVAGVNGQGWFHVENFHSMKDVRVVAVCDPDRGLLARRRAEFEKGREKLETFADIREMLDKADLDVVVVATPDHWHALAGVWAMQAGKDVYIEKPLTYCIWEGRQLVAAARRYGRIAQTGSQHRSCPATHKIREYVQSGKLGKIQLGVRAGVQPAQVDREGEGTARDPPRRRLRRLRRPGHGRAPCPRAAALRLALAVAHGNGRRRQLGSPHHRRRPQYHRPHRGAEVGDRRRRAFRVRRRRRDAQHAAGDLRDRELPAGGPVPGPARCAPASKPWITSGGSGSGRSSSARTATTRADAAEAGSTTGTASASSRSRATEEALTCRTSWTPSAPGGPRT